VSNPLHAVRRGGESGGTSRVIVTGGAGNGRCADERGDDSLPALTSVFGSAFARSLPPSRPGQFNPHFHLREERTRMQKVSPCLWFDCQAEEAANFYVSVFPNSRILGTTHSLEGAPRPAGSVLVMRFCLDGEEFSAINGGPQFTFSPAVSFVARCATQAEVDRLWERLCEGGQESQCGWLTDRYGVSWQIVPDVLMEMINSTDKAAAQRAFSALMTMKKLDIAALQRAYDKV
jgi:predicted 3-demethylubiquinone-9 3-methyltransferase (glyoxalase superfamily)